MNTKSIKTMPWLLNAYQQLIDRYANDHGHHALLVQSIKGVGERELLRAIGHFLLCQSKQVSPVASACGVCTSCKLIQASTHPDWHVLEPEKDKKSIGVDTIRTMTHDLQQHANQGGAKIIQIENLELLTEAAANALLKILEEPPANTFFLMTTYSPGALLATIKSRCLAYPLLIPSEEIAISWLEAESEVLTAESFTVALRLAHGAPIFALELLEETIWSVRMAFNKDLYASLQQRNYLQMVNALSGEYWQFNLECLMGYLLDALKYQSLDLALMPIETAKSVLTHIDRIDIILELAKQDRAILNMSLQHAVHMSHTLRHSPGINTELLVTNWLLDWQQHRIEPIYL